MKRSVHFAYEESYVRIGGIAPMDNEHGGPEDAEPEAYH